MKTYIAWMSGTENRYQILANSRKEALEKFAKKLNVNVSSYLQARVIKKEGEYCLLESGCYGYAHN